MHKKDIFVLEAIKNYLGAGNIHKQDTDSIQYRVSSIKDLQLVIDHFDKYFSKEHDGKKKEREVRCITVKYNLIGD